MINNTKIKTIIIEDAIEAQEYLASILNKNFDSIDILGYADNIEKSVTLIEQVKPELVFMDIELTDGNSFEIFNHLTYHDFEVIFVTAYDDFIKKAIDHYALSYILKPIDVVKLIETVKRYISKRQRLFSLGKIQSLSNFIDNKDSKFLVHIGDEYVSVNLKDIVKCEANGNYSYLFLTNGKKIMTSNNLKYYEGLLATKGFFKPHRSCLINTQHITSIYKKETIILTSGDKINVSVRNKSKLAALIIALS